MSRSQQRGGGASPWKGRKPGPYQWYEIQDSVDYYREFEKPKIIWSDISKLPRFSWDESGAYLNNTGYVISNAEPWLLALLQSRAIWYAISNISQPLRERAGLWQYRLIKQFMERVPIPPTTPDEKALLSTLAMQLTSLASERFQIDERGRSRIHSDLGSANRNLNGRLTAWWTLDFTTFRAEIKKVFKREIPVKERDEWDAWLTEQRREHERLTNEIIRLETELNAIVYQLFDLTPEEIAIIEESTKYQYGEV